MSTIHFTIPGPPVGKERARRGRGNRFYTPAKTKEYEAKVAALAQAAGIKPVLTACYLDVKWVLDPEGEPELQVALTQTDEMPPKGRRPDGDNVLKILADSMQGIGFKNDKQVTWWSLGIEL